MLIRFLISISFLLPLTVSSQGENGLVNWLSFKEAQEKYKTLPKPFLIDFYTDWCGWCKHMMKTTYSNAGLAGYINANFYPVKFNAETKDTIEYNGKIYKPLSKEPRTPHELTVKFLGNKLSYPSTVFVTNNFEYNLLVPGYLEDKKIEPMLVFMVENAWRSALFDDFNKHFNHTFYDTVFPKIPVKIHDISELESLQKKQAKKVLVSVGTGFCNSCKVMDKTTFSDTAVAAYINKKFYVVSLDAQRTDTLIFQKEKFHQTVLSNNFPVHSLAIKLTGGRLAFPTLSVLDEKLEITDVLNFYQSPERLGPVLKYFGENAYKTKTFQQFMEVYLKTPEVKTSKK